MKSLFLFIIFGLTLAANAQERKFKPFSIIILKPDTAIIDKSLHQFRDTITQTQIARYYRSVKTYEDMANCKPCDFEKEDLERYKRITEELKSIEPEIKKTRYFDMLSSFSSEIYNFYFNESDSYSIVKELPHQSTAIEDLQKLAEDHKADYVIYFSSVHTVIKNKNIELAISTSLFSKAENKIILSTETTGDLKSRGEIWACTNPLQCLFINAVRTSSNEVADQLRKLQGISSSRN